MKPQDRATRHMPTRSSTLRRLLLWTMAACLLAMSLTASARLFLSVNIAPPPLPVYEQPMMPGPGYLWIPGYWAYDDGGYFWVPGTWVLPPFVGALWTPGYWGWNNGLYVFNAGYWGTSVGFYGGINYGFGYNGDGYWGGRWNHGRFSYNRAVNRIDPRYARHVYDRPVHRSFNRVSYNGGRGGVTARSTTTDRHIAGGRRVQAVAAQQRQVRLASRNRALRASVNHGAPAIAATRRAGVFDGSGVARANAAYRTMGRGTVAANRNSASGQRAARMAPMHGRAQLAAPRSAGYAPRNRGGTQSLAHENRAGAYRQPAARGHVAREGSMRQGMSNPQRMARTTERNARQRDMSRPEAMSRPHGTLRREAMARPGHMARPEAMPRSHGTPRPARMARPQGMARPGRMARPEGMARPQAHAFQPSRGRAQPRPAPRQGSRGEGRGHH